MSDGIMEQGSYEEVSPGEWALRITTSAAGESATGVSNAIREQSSFVEVSPGVWARRVTAAAGGSLGDGGDAATLNGEAGTFYLDRTNHTGTQAIDTIVGLQSALQAADDKIGLGFWNATTNNPTLADGPGAAENNNYYIVEEAGTQNLGSGSEAYEEGDEVVFHNSDNRWHRVGRTDAVQSVAGKTGVVTLVKADVGLGNIDNTSDANKPISAATQTALNLKANESEVVKLTGAQSVAGAKTLTDRATFSGVSSTAESTVMVKSSGPAIDLWWTGAPADEKRWSWTPGYPDGDFILQTLSDDGTQNKVAHRILRTGVDVNQHDFYAGDAVRFSVHEDGQLNASNGYVPNAATSLTSKEYVDSAIASIPDSPVTSVAGRTGAVVLTKADVALSNVDNTSDASKPVSTAQAASIATKVNTSDKASQAQAQAGTDDTKWMTPLKTAQAISAQVHGGEDANVSVYVLKQDANMTDTTGVVVADFSTITLTNDKTEVRLIEGEFYVSGAHEAGLEFKFSNLNDATITYNGSAIIPPNAGSNATYIPYDTTNGVQVDPADALIQKVTLSLYVTSAPTAGSYGSLLFSAGQQTAFGSPVTIHAGSKITSRLVSSA